MKCCTVAPLPTLPWTLSPKASTIIRPDFRYTEIAKYYLTQATLLSYKASFSLLNSSNTHLPLINFQKTKVIVFSRVKLPSDKYYFYYGPNSIEIIENYKYLGVIFNYNGRFQLAASSLADKAKKSLFCTEIKTLF